MLLFSEGAFAGRVGRCTLPCTSGVEVVAGSESFEARGGENGAVYWPTIDVARSNLRRLLDGASGRNTLATDTSVQQMEVNGGDVIFAARGSGVKAVPRDGGATRRLYEPLTQTERFAIDGTVVYFNDSVTLGRILRCDVAGCGDAGTTLASSQNRPYAVVVDKTNIYWTNLGDGNAGSNRSPREVTQKRIVSSARAPLNAGNTRQMPLTQRRPPRFWPA